MSNVVVVAIPEDDDYIWKISSEKIPHITLLYLDDVSSDHDWSKIIDFIEHAAETTLRPMMVEVDHRGTLGDDADVLFLDKRSSSYGVKQLETFRQQLLQNNAIHKAYAAVEQYPEWTPHITLGYPESPAKEDTRDHPGIRWVDIDRIAIWTGDYEGPEFRLTDEDYGDEVVAMADKSDPDVVVHYGVKGMKWGVRKDRASSAARTVKKKAAAGAVEVANAYNKARPKSEDAAEAIATRRQKNTKGVSSLSNKELETLIRRMNLEQQLKDLEKRKRESSLASAFVADQLVSLGARKVDKLNPNSPEAAAIRTAMGQLKAKKKK